MKFKEIWDFCIEGKLYIIFLIAFFVYIVVNFFITDIATSLLLFIVCITFIGVPLFWFLVIIRIKKKRLKSEYEWKHGVLFEYLFFLSLFVCQYSLAFFIYYLDKGSDLWQMIISSIIVLMFGISAIFSGFCHYIYKFDIDS